MSMPELNQTLEALHFTMLQYQHSRDYKDAEIYRTLHETCKNYILQRNITNTEQKYKMLTYENNNARRK